MKYRLPPDVPLAMVISGQERAKPPDTLGRPDDSFEQMRYVFHELHAEGHHALCEVCCN
jgi:hypothetical protein